MNATGTKRTLVVGIGNDGRGDDGLGWKFVELNEKSFAHMDWQQRYQLQVEDAALVSQYDQVIFVDSTRTSLNEGFAWNESEVRMSRSFSTHNLDPSTVLYLARELYNRTPRAFTLAIEGQQWEIGIGLSDQAQENLQKAMLYFHELFIAPAPLTEA